MEPSASVLQEQTKIRAKKHLVENDLIERTIMNVVRFNSPKKNLTA
jgi:hypothetical protein